MRTHPILISLILFFCSTANSNEAAKQQVYLGYFDAFEVRNFEKMMSLYDHDAYFERVFNRVPGLAVILMRNRAEPKPPK